MGNNIGLNKKELHYNTSEFTVAAQHFREFKTYTRYPVNTAPTSQWYKFWVEEARRCLYGYNIGRDEIPGYYYWYLNYCPIEKAIKIEDEAKPSPIIIPDTSLRYNTDKNIESKDEFNLEIPNEYDYESVRGERVTDFPDFWESDYEYYWYLEEAEQKGLHAAVIKTRGRGYSFKGASMLDRNFYLIPRSKSYAFASEKEYLISDGILTKAWDMMGHIEINTPWGKRKSKIDTMMHKRASYMKLSKGVMSELGFGSEIIGISFKNNIDKGRGKRGKLILWEEAGKFPNLLPAWNISLRSMAQGRITFGLMIAFGTGGTDMNDLIGIEQLYTRGDGYKVYLIPNRYEPEMGYDKTALFIGEQRNHEIGTDKDGNSHPELTLKYIEEDREKYLRQTKNRDMYLRYCAEAPIKPSEALMQIGDNFFPTDLLKQQKAYLLSHKATHLDSAWIGTLSPDPESGKISWKPDKDAVPIDHYPHNDVVNINGAVVIWEPPVTNRDGIVPYGLYISGNDNYDHDKSTTDSLGSTFIMNRATERIVAEYTGRPAKASIFYSINMYLLKYYNASQNFENNLQGIRNYLRQHHSEGLLCDTPEILMNKIDDKRVLGRIKGSPGTTPIKKYGRELILDWLLRPIGETDDRFNLHTIRSIALLDELIYYNSTGNFDRIDALLYLMILHEDKWRHIPDIDQTPKKKLHPFFANNPLIKNNQNSSKAVINETVGMKVPYK